MKLKWMLGPGLAAAMFVSPAFGQISVFIGTPPPPVRYEVAPPMPTVGYVWTPGYWTPYGGHYVWAPGRWARPPYYGASWRTGGWYQEPRGWYYRPGGWAPRGYYGGPPRYYGGPPHGHAYGHYKHDKHGYRD